MKAAFTATDLDGMLWYRRLDNMTAQEMAARIRREGPANDKMRIGTAWHSMLENPPADTLDVVELDGFVFRIECDGDIVLPQVREIRASKEYLIDNITVTLSGGCDGIDGNRVTDHKLTFNPQPENYLESLQWRAYLDIFNADTFRYYLYHAQEKGRDIIIKEVSSLMVYRYPGMEADLCRGIYDLVQFAKEFTPEKFEES